MDRTETIVHLYSSETILEFAAFLHKDNNLTIIKCPSYSKKENILTFNLVVREDALGKRIPVLCRITRSKQYEYSLSITGIGNRKVITYSSVKNWPNIAKCPDWAARSINLFCGDMTIRSNPGFFRYLRDVSISMKKSIPVQAARLKDKEIK